MALDTLVVLGYGPVLEGGRLGIYARLAALAAGTLLAQHKTKRLLITGGKTGGAALPSEAALMAGDVARTFSVAPGQLVLEERACDTLENLVLSANILDAEGPAGDRLGFLALRLHLPRVQRIADFIGLSGEGVALEPLTAARSARHRALLERLEASPSYARLAAAQHRAMRGLDDLPEFWLAPLGKLQDPTRLRRVQHHPAAEKLELPDDPTAFGAALRSLARRFPDPHPDDQRLGLEAARG